MKNVVPHFRLSLLLSVIWSVCHTVCAIAIRRNNISNPNLVQLVYLQLQVTEVYGFSSCIQESG